MTNRLTLSTVQNLGTKMSQRGLLCIPEKHVIIQCSVKNVGYNTYLLEWGGETAGAGGGL